MNLLGKLVAIDKNSLLENTRQAKQYVKQGILSKDDLKRLIEIDPSDSRKYVGWMAKQLTKQNANFDELKSYVEEYHTLSEKGKVRTKDIYQIKTFKDLKSEVDDINNSGEAISVKELESDYEVVIDNEQLLIAVPHTHQASRKLGLSDFSYRSCGDGETDSAWCTTYKAPDHFNSYYYQHDVTFYYIKVRSKELLAKLKEEFPRRGKAMVVVALAVLESGQIDGYDGTDSQLSQSEVKKYTDIIGIS